MKMSKEVVHKIIDNTIKKLALMPHYVYIFLEDYTNSEIFVLGAWREA